MIFSKEDLLPYVSFKTSRSGGKGGQHVNKVSSKAELNFDFQSADLFAEEQKRRIADKLVNRMTANGMIQVISDEARSQIQNKERALEKLYVILRAALVVQKPRKATKPRRPAVERRPQTKEKQAFKKLGRKGNWGPE